MHAVAVDDNPRTRRALYRQLLQSTLLLPSNEALGPGLGGWTALKKTTRLGLVTTTGPQGERILLAFTDEQALLRWKPTGSSYVGLHAMDLFRLALDNDVAGVLVNVAGPAGGTITRGEMEVLASGGTPGQPFSAPDRAIEDPAVLLDLGQSAQEQGNLAAARASCAKSLAIFGGRVDAQGAARALLQLAWIDFREGHLAAAREKLARAAPVLEDAQDREQVQKLQAALSRAELDRAS